MLIHVSAALFTLFTGVYAQPSIMEGLGQGDKMLRNDGRRRWHPQKALMEKRPFEGDPSHRDCNTLPTQIHSACFGGQCFTATLPGVIHAVTGRSSCRNRLRDLFQLANLNPELSTLMEDTRTTVAMLLLC